MKIYFLLFIIGFFLQLNIIFAQLNYVLDPITQLKNNEENALFPFTGGLNNPQFQSIDINQDGIKDLLIFDRSGFKVLPFLNSGVGSQEAFTYDPSLESIFPKMQYWCVFVDYNCDGIEDIFTANENNVKYFEADISSGFLKYNLITDLVTFHEAGFTFNLGVGIIDIPGFADINLDGDIDILTFNLSGGIVDYYENMRIENGLNCDSIYLEHLDGCWGNFYESGITKSVDLDYVCKGIVSKSNDGMHAGSTFLIYDEDFDEDMDVVLGDLAFNNLNRLINGGDNLSAHIIEQDTAFPIYDLPYQVEIFPAPFLIDMDNDGKKDLIVSPNKDGGSENFKNVWFYKNISVDEKYTFEFQNDSFFVSDMVDAGEFSRAVFFDYNADQLLDIVIGNDGYYQFGDFVTSLTLYKNIGTNLNPKYQLVTRDYANLSLYGFQNIAPFFGDLDGDEDDDLIIGTSDGNMHVFINSASLETEANFSIFIPNYKGIDPGINSAPQIIDVNDDGLNDLIIGENNGGLNYYQNNGPAFNPTFTLVDEFWGNVDVKVAGSLSGNSVPFLIKNETGAEELYVGSESGTIYLYEPTPDFTGAFTLITNSFSAIDDGKFVSVNFADLTGDGIPEILTGNARGGIGLYRAEGTFEPIQTHQYNNGIKIFPVPASQYIKFETSKKIEKIKVYNTVGKLISTQQYSEELNIENYPSGIYFIQFIDAQNVLSVFKFIKL